jgi:hypothetical protein
MLRLDVSKKRPKCQFEIEKFNVRSRTPLQLMDLIAAHPYFTWRQELTHEEAKKDPAKVISLK